MPGPYWAHAPARAEKPAIATMIQMTVITMPIMLMMMPAVAGPLGTPAALDWLRAMMLTIRPASENTNASTRPTMPSVFPSATGDSHFQGVEKIWRKVRASAGFPTLRLHDLRHSFASAGLARGDALPVIGAILGHADVKTTSRYAHLADDPVKLAADAISQTVAAALSGVSGATVVPLRPKAGH